MFFPMVYYREIDKKNASFLLKFRGILTIAFFVLVLLLIIFREQAYIIMGARNYIQYSGLFVVLSVAQLLSIISNFWNTFLGYSLKTHITMLVSIVTIFINIGLLLLLIKPLGIYAAAYAILISNVLNGIVLIGISMYYEKKFIASDKVISCS